MAPSEIGHYRIIRRLGAGGMGEVFLAEDILLGRKVAIKMLSEMLAGSHLARERLINEAKAAAALDHPGHSRRAVKASARTPAAPPERSRLNPARRRSSCCAARRT